MCRNFQTVPVYHWRTIEMLSHLVVKKNEILTYFDFLSLSGYIMLVSVSLVNKCATYFYAK